MSTLSSQVASHLLNIKAIKLSPKNPFTWASGLSSPIYCDNRIALSHPEVRKFIIEAFKQKLWAMGDFDMVAGVATAGIPHGVLLAELIGKPFIYVRSKSKEHGRKNQIEGEVKAGQKVLVIEDLISTGMSSMAACEALLDKSVKIAGVMAIFTYGFPKSKDLFSKNRIPLETLTNYSTLLKIAEETNYITGEEKILLEKWNSDPKSWSEAYQSKI